MHAQCHAYTLLIKLIRFQSTLFCRMVGCFLREYFSPLSLTKITGMHHSKYFINNNINTDGVLDWIYLR